VCRFHIAASEKLHADNYFFGAIVWRSSHVNYALVFFGAIGRSVAKLASINLRKFGFLLLVR
jgi:hypothetical protein